MPIKLVNKFYRYKKILMMLSIAVLASVAFLLCLIIYGIRNSLHSEKQFYSLSIDGIPNKYEIVLYEYNSFRDQIRGVYVSRLII